MMRTWSLVILVAVLASNVSAAPPAPAPEQVRGAVEKSLPYIETVSTAWMRERNCNSCHNVTFLIWSENEAAARGLNVDRAKLSEWTKWSLADALSDRYWFKLRPRAIVSLKSDGLSQTLLDKLTPLVGKTYLTQKDYLLAVEKAVGKEALEVNKDRLLKAGALPNNGGGPDTLSQILLGRDSSSQDASENESYKAVRALLLQWQEPDGSWQAQGQLPGLKWANASEMHACTTMWCLLAVGADKTNDPALAGAKQRALASLKDPAPSITIQSLALRFIVADKFAEPAQRDAPRKDLLNRQNADGGWSWVKENKTSDAFATGQVLYALYIDGHGPNDPSITRAVEFLMQTQQKDGSWQVPQEAINTRHRNLNVYNYWGTAWATIGLLQTLPQSK